MKKLLYIAYFFPPMGGAGVQRSLKFCRYLPDSGWMPTVLTGPSSYWLRDESLLTEVDPGIEVVRSKQFGARFTGGGGGGTRRSGSQVQVLRRLSRLVLVPDAYVGWAVPARQVASRLIRERKFDAILTTSSPDSAHLLGLRLKRATGLPWVADFRDPWTRRMAYAPPSSVHHWIHRRMERSVLEGADAVLVTSGATREDFLERTPGLDPGKISVVTNGFDEEDFAASLKTVVPSGLELGAVPPLEDCPILHAGHLNPERPLAPYLEGMSIFVERSPERASETRTLFLGGHYDHDVDAVRSRGLEDLVVFSGNRPHRESVAALLRSKMLLLLEQDSDRGALILPGKIFEYLRSERPILAIVPNGGAAARLIRECDAGFVADPARPETIAEGIDRLLSSGPSSGATSESVARFERRNLTVSLAGILDSISGK